MLTLRNAHPSLTQGSYEAAAVNGSLLSFQRRSGRMLNLVAINYGGSKVQVRLPGLPPRARLQAIYPAQAKPVRTDAKGRLSLSLPAQSITVFDLRT